MSNKYSLCSNTHTYGVYTCQSQTYDLSSAEMRASSATRRSCSESRDDGAPMDGRFACVQANARQCPEQNFCHGRLLRTTFWQCLQEISNIDLGSCMDDALQRRPAADGVTSRRRPRRNDSSALHRRNAARRLQARARRRGANDDARITASTICFMVSPHLRPDESRSKLDKIDQRPPA